MSICILEFSVNDQHSDTLANQLARGLEFDITVAYSVFIFGLIMFCYLRRIPVPGR